MSATRNLLLWVAATDSTFRQKVVRGTPMLVGRCIHCRSQHALLLDGTPVSGATLEHIVPQCHGGTNDLSNIAVACTRCNSEKGIRHDRKRWSDPKLQALVAALQGRRAAQMRDPLPGLLLPPLKGTT